MYDLSNTIFCPIGSALTKHPVASQIWTHNWAAFKIVEANLAARGAFMIVVASIEAKS